MTADTPDPRPEWDADDYYDEPDPDLPDPRPVSPPSELTAALLRIFDLAENRPDIRAVVTAALDAARAAPQADQRDETIERLKRALRVATHTPHDRDGDPDDESGFPTCSGCGAILTGAAPQADEGLRAAATDAVAFLTDVTLSGSSGMAIANARRVLRAALAAAPVPAGLDVERLADALALHQRKDGLIQPPLVAEGNGYRMATPTEFARALSQLPEDAP